jgi:hypothetical protein
MKNFIRKKNPPSLKGTEGRRNFVRKIENFLCEHCEEKVTGDGYTDHCPKCLWGKHVDKEIPGDRASECGGLMEPIRVLYEKGGYKISYKCLKCNHEFKVRSDESDDKDKLVELVNN